VDVTRAEVLKHYVRVEMSKEIPLSKTDEFLGVLNENELAYLVRVLSRYRKNDMEGLLLDENRTWELVMARIDGILVTKINDKVNMMLEDNEYELKSIADDPELCGHEEFDSRGRPVVDEKVIAHQDTWPHYCSRWDASNHKNGMRWKERV
jgi:hypothetical protein